MLAAILAGRTGIRSGFQCKRRCGASTAAFCAPIAKHFNSRKSALKKDT